MPHLTKKISRFLILAAMVTPISACQTPAEDDQRAYVDYAVHEVRVVTSGGFTAAYNILAPQFEKETEIRLITAYGASSGGASDSIPVRLERGEEFDVVILSQSSLHNLIDLGSVHPDTRKDLVRSSIGMAVREGAHVPDISTPELLIETLLNAGSIGYSASASGTYLSTVLFPKLGLWGQLEPKSERILGERVATVVARGDVEIGFQQISEILPIEGAKYGGPIPLEYQKVTTFSAGITMHAQNAADAKKLIDYLSSAEVAATIAGTGLEPVVTEK